MSNRSNGRPGLATRVLGQSLGTLLGGGSLMGVGSLVGVLDSLSDTEAVVICALGGSAMAALGHRAWRTERRIDHRGPTDAREEWAEFLSERAELTRRPRRPGRGSGG